MSLSMSISSLIRKATALLCAAFVAGPALAGSPIIINSYVFGGHASQDAFEIMTSLGETTSLEFCVDAGDSASYDGSSQVWTDLTANGQSFERGALGTADAADPTFNGSSGGLSTAEFFSFDGGDFFEYDSANETWMTNAHKNNATFTFVFWYYIDALGVIQSLAGDLGNADGANTGFRIYLSTTGELSLEVEDAGGDALKVASGLSVTENAWNFIAVSVDEAAGAGGVIYHVNTSTATDTSTYSTPSTGNAANPLSIGSQGNNVLNIEPTGRVAMACGWSRAVSSASLTTIEAATDDRGF
jgi:hypothetical protein